MDAEKYESEKQDFETGKAAFLENELAILAHIEQLHALLEIRQPLVSKLKGQRNPLSRAASELKKGDAIRFDRLVDGDTFGEIVKAWMDRYYDRKRGGHDLSYERLISNREEPREKLGKRYSSSGQEFEVEGSTQDIAGAREHD